MGNSAMNYATEQEEFWAGEFGNAYVERSKDAGFVAADTAFFARVLGRTSGIRSVIEFGANVGLNLLAIRNLLPEAELSGVEINALAANHLRSIPGLTVYERSLIGFEPDRTRDFVLTKGVLIHLAPAVLPDIYDLLYRSCARYICVAEYYNPTPVEIAYRGHAGKLFKRDFAGELLERYADLSLVDYGFVYRRDPNFRQDDLTWFLLEKLGQA